MTTGRELDYALVEHLPEAGQLYRKILAAGKVKDLPAKALVLDIGGGSGGVGKILVNDFPTKRLRYVNAELKAEHVASSPGVGVVADRAALPFKQNSADLVLYLFPGKSSFPAWLEFHSTKRLSPWEEKALHWTVFPLVEALRVLKPGGKLVFAAHAPSRQHCIGVNRELDRFFKGSGFGEVSHLQVVKLPDRMHRVWARHQPQVGKHVAIHVLEKRV